MASLGQRVQVSIFNEGEQLLHCCHCKGVRGKEHYAKPKAFEEFQGLPRPMDRGIVEQYNLAFPPVWVLEIQYLAKLAYKVQKGFGGVFTLVNCEPDPSLA